MLSSLKRFPLVRKPHWMKIFQMIKNFIYKIALIHRHYALIERKKRVHFSQINSRKNNQKQMIGEDKNYLYSLTENEGETRAKK